MLSKEEDKIPLQFSKDFWAGTLILPQFRGSPVFALSFAPTFPITCIAPMEPFFNDARLEIDTHVPLSLVVQTYLRSIRYNARILLKTNFQGLGALFQVFAKKRWPKHEPKHPLTMGGPRGEAPSR